MTSLVIRILEEEEEGYEYLECIFNICKVMTNKYEKIRPGFENLQNDLWLVTLCVLFPTKNNYVKDIPKIKSIQTQVFKG